ncbi:MAG: glycosyltransferase family 2 protein [Deltaproteobacteria bacterium]
MKIDILLSTYNGEKFIREQLDSLLGQTFQDWRLLIRDDGSLDATIEIIQEYSKRYPEKIVFINDQDKHLGACFSFARLLELSDAEYMMFCDQDDVWLDNKIEITLAKMLEMEKAYFDKPILVHTDLKVADQNLKVSSDSIWRYQKLNPERQSLNYMLVENNVTGCTVLINKKLKELVMPFSKEAIIHDWWLALVASALGKIGYVKQPTILYRQHGRNEIGAKKYSLKYFIKKFENKNKMTNLFYNIFKQSKALEEVYGSLMEESERKTAQRFSTLLEQSRLARIRTIIKYRFTKNGVLRNFGYLGFIFSLHKAL